MNVSLIIPAKNEEKYISNVLKVARSALTHHVVNEVIVVDDNSTDGTAKLALASGLKVVKTKESHGKAAAMCVGTDIASGDIYLFLDADLSRLKLEHLKKLLKPFESDNNLGMVIGQIFDYNLVTFFGQTLSPQLSGQRAVRKEIFEEIKKIEGINKSGYGIDLLLLKFCRAKNIRYQYTSLFGIGITTKEKKEEFSQAFIKRINMYREIILSYWRIKFEEKEKEYVSCHPHAVNED